MPETVTVLAILRGARRIVEDGGTPNPCELGAYCPYCCLAIAKDCEEDRLEIEEENWPTIYQDVLFGTLTYLETDRPLIEARQLLVAHDKSVAHDRASALALLDLAIAEAEHA